MTERQTLTRFDIINNRILVRNTHKLVYKKLANFSPDIWCDKYLSVASTKLMDPKHTYKLPFSLNKRVKTQQSYSTVLKPNNAFPKKKTQVLAIHDIRDSRQLITSKTIDHEGIGDANQRAERLLERLKKTSTRASLKANHRNYKISKKLSMCLKSKDQFQIEPWMVENMEQQDKQNKFF